VRLLLVVAAALVLAGSAYAVKPRVVGIGEQQDGENAHAHVGDTLVVTLGNPATGRWQLGAFNRRILRFDSTGSVRARRPPLVAGARAITIFTFKVLALGATPLNLRYVSSTKRLIRDYSVRIQIERPED
jgi:hypothetical protein